MRGKSYQGIRDAIRKHASQPDGCNIFDIPGVMAHKVAQNARLMPEIIAVGYRSQRRLFTDRVAAERYEHTGLPALKAQREEEKRAGRRVKQQAEKAPPKQPKLPDPAKPVSPHWRKDPPVTIPRYTGQKWDKDKPADYSRAKLTVYPSHPGYDMRYSLPPGAKVEGEFSRIPLGATLEAA